MTILSLVVYWQIEDMIFGLFWFAIIAVLFMTIVATSFLPVRAQPKAKYCSQCGAGLTKEAIFCHKCGNKVEGNAHA